MFNIPDTEKKLKSSISSYKSALNKEKRIYGHINDGGGKRYSLFILYFALNDLKKAYDYFEWYKEEFPDDVGEPIQKLCWAICLHRMEKDDEAEYMLAELMLSNLYMIPQIIGQNVNEYNMWHSSSDASADYFEYIPEEVLKSIKGTEAQWMKRLYNSFEFNRIRKRYIEIYHDLKDTKDIESRKKLVNESRSLLNNLKHGYSPDT
jgi:hypothetical protein